MIYTWICPASDECRWRPFRNSANHDKQRQAESDRAYKEWQRNKAIEAAKAEGATRWEIRLGSPSGRSLASGKIRTVNAYRYRFSLIHGFTCTVGANSYPEALQWMMDNPGYGPMDVIGLVWTSDPNPRGNNGIPVRIPEEA